MPRIPDSWLGGKIKNKLTELKENKMQLLTISMALVVFIVCSIEMVSFYIPDHVSKKTYEEFLYPLFTLSELFIFSLFFLFKSFRYTSCLDTKVVSIMLCIMFLVSILALVFQFKVFYYLLLLQPLILGVIMLLTLTNILKWFWK